MRLVTAFALVSAACGETHFQCEQPSDCGVRGQCEPGGGCSFPDSECPSGRRFGKYASPELAGTCVAPTPAGDTGDASATSPSSSHETAGDAGEDTLAIDDATTTGSPTEPTMGAPSTDPTGQTGDTRDDATDTGDATAGTGDTGVPAVGFVDDFERPDADVIGNGWWEKTPAAFVLEAGAVLHPVGTESYPDNLVLRPEAESVADVEVWLGFHYLTATTGNPQIHVRVQPESEDPGDLTGYILFIDNPGSLVVTRQEDAAFAMTQSVPTGGLVVGEPYRLRLVITGDDPVVLDGALELQAEDQSWSEVVSIHVEDADPTRITAPGRLGFSAHVELSNFAYGDFEWAPAP